MAGLTRVRGENIIKFDLSEEGDSAGPEEMYVALIQKPEGNYLCIRSRTRRRLKIVVGSDELYIDHQ